jgi:hypothetical protein
MKTYYSAFSSTRPRQFPTLSFLDKAFYFAKKHPKNRVHLQDK